MSKKQTGKMLKVKTARINQKKAQKTAQLQKAPVTRMELFAIQNAINARLDSIIRAVSGIAVALRDKNVLDLTEYKAYEGTVTEIFKFIRDTYIEATKILGEDATTDTINKFVLDKADAFKIDKDVLENIFNIKTESVIVTPSNHAIIKPR